MHYVSEQTDQQKQIHTYEHIEIHCTCLAFQVCEEGYRSTSGSMIYIHTETLLDLMLLTWLSCSRIFELFHLILCCSVLFSVLGRTVVALLASSVCGWK